MWEARAGLIRAVSQSNDCLSDHCSVPFVHPISPLSLQGHGFSEHLDITLLNGQMQTVDVSGADSNPCYLTMGPWLINLSELWAP